MQLPLLVVIMIRLSLDVSGAPPYHDASTETLDLSPNPFHNNKYNLTSGLNPIEFLKLNSTTLTLAGEPHHVQNTDITLWITNYPRHIHPKVLRAVIWNALTLVSNIVDVAGDGELPSSEDPFTSYMQDEHGGAVALEIESLRIGARKMRWSDVKNALVGLYDYMVRGRKQHCMRFTIEDVGEGLIGRGALYSPIILPETGVDGRE